MLSPETLRSSVPNSRGRHRNVGGHSRGGPEIRGEGESACASMKGMRGVNQGVKSCALRGSLKRSKKQERTHRVFHLIVVASELRFNS